MWEPSTVLKRKTGEYCYHFDSSTKLTFIHMCFSLLKLTERHRGRTGMMFNTIRKLKLHNGKEIMGTQKKTKDTINRGEKLTATPSNVLVKNKLQRLPANCVAMPEVV